MILHDFKRTYVEEKAGKHCSPKKELVRCAYTCRPCKYNDMKHNCRREKKSIYWTNCNFDLCDDRSDALLPTSHISSYFSIQETIHPSFEPFITAQLLQKCDRRICEAMAERATRCHIQEPFRHFGPRKWSPLRPGNWLMIQARVARYRQATTLNVHTVGQQHSSVMILRMARKPTRSGAAEPSAAAGVDRLYRMLFPLTTGGVFLRLRNRNNTPLSITFLHLLGEKGHGETMK